MDIGSEIKQWMRADLMRYSALEEAASLGLQDWCLAAGFVRNLVWDKLHGYPRATPLSDIDLIYFDPSNLSADRDAWLEAQLKPLAGTVWSVKNQARMHLRNNDRPYNSTAQAMQYWVEIETAVGARLTANKDIELVAPFGLDALNSLSVTLNPMRPKPTEFRARVQEKKWLEIWPKLRVIGLG